MDYTLKGIAKALKLPEFPPWREGEYTDAQMFNTTPRRMLEFNIYWESKAIEGYDLHIARCLLLGDDKTARVFEHNRDEEVEHLNMLIARLKELI